VRRDVAVAIIGLLVAACSSGVDDEPKTPWNTDKCTPGTVRGCTCGDESGLAKCDFNALWGLCDCSGDVTIEPDTVLPGDATSVTPTSANLPAIAASVSGVGRLHSEQYELQIVIGPTSPISSVASETFAVSLGPVCTHCDK
jgi:hypothetical protein